MGTPLTAVDLKRLAAEVSVQHGIRIDPDDPMLAVVTLNRLVFEDALAHVLDRVQSSVRDFEVATEKVQIRAGAILAQEVRECGVEFRQLCRQAFEESSPSSSETQCSKRGDVLPRWNSTLGVIAIALVLFAVGVWVGRTLR